jgi:hypothetical protein
MCEVFRQHPGESLTAADLAARGGIDFRDVHQRLLDTPELFVRLPKRPNTSPRYRLATALAGSSPAEIAAFIDAASRAESRTAAIVIAAFVLVFVIALSLSLLR